MEKKVIKMNVESAVVKAEIAYMVNKMFACEDSKKEYLNHYSKLYKATEDKLAELGLKRADTKTKWGARYKYNVPSKNSNAYKALVAFVGDNFKPNVEKAELDYIIEKIRLAKTKDEGKKFTCHYSALHKATLKALADMGIKVDTCGKHGYRMYYPTKKSKAWYKLNMYGKVEKDANGHFAKKAC